MKKIVIIMVVAVTAIAAKADLLYFMANAFDWTGPKLFDYASIGVARDGEANWNDGNKVFLTIYAKYDSTTGTDAIQSDADRYHAVGWADVSEYTDPDVDYSFYLETYVKEGGVVSWSNPLWGYSSETAKSYSKLVAANHVYIPGKTDAQDVTMWVVPEPSSGLLLLLGVAGLALRRHR